MTIATVDQALFARLSGAAAVAAAVGTRIYPVVAEQAAVRPFVTYRRSPGDRIASFQGPSGLARPRFVVECFADDIPGARALATAVRQALDGYLGDPAAGDAVIRGVTIESDFEDFDEPSRSYVVSATYAIWHNE